MSSTSSQTAETRSTDLQVEVEEVSSIVRRLKVVVPEANVSRELDKALRDVRKRTRIKGFRPGKAPLKLIEERYGAELQDEVLERVINESFRAAVKQTKLQPAAPGVIEEKDWKPGKTLDFTARVELWPDVEVANYKGIEVERTVPRVSNAEVDEQIEQARQSQAQAVPVTNRETAEDTDIVVVNMVGTMDDDGEPTPDTREGRREGVEIHLEHDPLPGIKEQIVGVRVGEKREVKVQFPEEHHVAQLRGRSATYEIEVVELKHREVPEADDDFAKDLEFESLLAMRGKIREDLQASKQRASEEEVRGKLLVKLLEQHPFEVPQAIVERQATAMARDLGERLQRAGVDPDRTQQEIERSWDRLWRDATFVIKRSYVLDEIADKENVEVTQADLDAHYEKMAKASGASVDRVRAGYAHAEQQAGLKRRLREDKTLEFLVSEAKINDVEPQTQET